MRTVEPLGREDDRHRVKALARARLFGDQPAVKVGRFSLLQRIGSGGMGVVYSAYDPQLDRRVAIKLLYPEKDDGSGRTPLADSPNVALLDGDATEVPAIDVANPNTEQARRDLAKPSEKQQRLIREAQALARLNHPNVITVYEVGTHDGAVFVAMEFVDGETVGEWIGKAEPSWREVLDVYCRAGLGLVAAHAAGLVHRDFKPENVMLGRDARVRVLDFGLARPLNDTDPSDQPSLHEPEVQALRQLTATGMLAGTPRYMAPEQFGGAVADARCDQFALCVSMYEGLFGHAPFAGDSLQELVGSVTRGEMREPPQSSGVPRFVRTAIMRGLDTDPNARWASVAELIDALRRPSSAKWTRTAAWVGGSAVIVGGLFLVFQPNTDEEQTVCRGGPDKLVGVWDATVRNNAGAAFLAADLPFAARAWQSVASTLDRYAEEWMDSYADACEATQIRGDQSQELLDLRMACLERRLASLRGVTEVLGAPDADVIERAPLAISGLPSLESCSDTEALRARVAPPADPAARDQVEELRQGLAEVEGAMKLGRHAQQLAELDRLGAIAAELDYPPALAETMLVRGKLLLETNQHLEAKPTLERSLLEAEAGRHYHVAAEAAAMLVFAGGFIEGERKARELDALARAKIRGLGGDDSLDLLRIRNLGTALSFEGIGVEAAALFERAIPRAEHHYGPGSLELASMSYAAGQALVTAEQFTRGIEHLRRALTSWEEALGPEHPYLIDVHTQIGRAAVGKLDADLATLHLEKGLAIVESSPNVGHRRRAFLHARLGEALGLQPGKEDAALQHIDRALQIAEQGGAVWVRIGTLTVKTWALAKHGRIEEAAAVAEEGLALSRRKYGPETPAFGEALFAMAEIEQERGEYTKARERYEHAKRLLAPRNPQHPALAHVFTALGECALGVGDDEQALELLERAVELRGGGEAWGAANARTRFALARALTRTGGDSKRATELAQRALEEFTSANDTLHQARVQKWSLDRSNSRELR